MVQNRPKLIDLLIGNLSNAVLHTILEKSIKNELKDKYRKESLNSFQIAKIYRQRINPTEKPFSNYDSVYIKEKIKSKIKSELLLRISKGYQNLSLDSIDAEIKSALKEIGII